MSQPIIETLRRVTSFLEKSEIEYMLIGGYALPFYGAIRATMDIDIAVAIEVKEQFDTFIKKANEFGYSPQIYSFLNPLCLLLDDKTGLEIEL